MPIRHTDKGWWFGSKGPFDTKAKALAVGRAAYANGYREQQMDKQVIGEFVATLLHSATVTHLFHLQVKGPGSFAAHSALGAYYDEIVDLVDSLAESIQGVYGIIDDYPPSFANVNGTPLEYLRKVQAYVQDVREEMPDDTEIQNDIDSIATLINHTVYKLENLA